MRQFKMQMSTQREKKRKKREKKEKKMLQPMKTAF